MVWKFVMKGKKYWKTVLFNIYNSLYLIVISIGLIILYVICFEFNDIVPMEIASTIMGAGIILATERLIHLTLKRITKDFLYADNSEEKFTYYRKVTKVINNRHYKDIKKLFWSFIFWFALCFFVLPIFYVMPYAITSFATSEKWLIKLYKDGKMV